MKKILFLLVCSTLFALSSQADEQKKINLSSNNAQQTIRLAYCNIFITLNENDNEDSGTVDIELENLDEEKVLILFDRAYPEKSIKKMPTSIRFDKTFGGTKNQRVVDPSSVKLNKVMLFRPSDKYRLPQETVDDESPTTCRLPIYVAKYKGSKKLLLLEKQVIELDIEADLGPGKDYADMRNEVDKMMEELSNKPFCPNSKHRPTLAKQKEVYEKQIDCYKLQIDSIIIAHDWKPSSKGYRTFNELKKELSDISLNEYQSDCGKHKSTAAAGHKCKYCSLSLQQIYHQLDDLYKRIYSSGNRKEAKAAVMAQVNALFQCCTDSQCSQHAATWKKGSDYKNKIVERYNRINSL